MQAAALFPRETHGVTPRADAARRLESLVAARVAPPVSGLITMGADRNPIKPVAMIKIDKGEMGFAGWVKP